MTRSIGHLLLILVVLACPVQCVIGAGSCCASESSSVSVADDQLCRSNDDCCRHAVSGSESSDAADEHSSHIPNSDQDCNCDCLCKGAIASVSQIDYSQDATIFELIDGCEVDRRCELRGLGKSQSNPPDAFSGREIRALRMSFQI
ncbi:MAG: hypothetical protein ACKVHE_09740 [Planctomycetales bacterium]|jgi:hypothetical protein